MTSLRWGWPCIRLVGLTSRLGNTYVTTRGNICNFSKFFAPGLYFCAQFCVRTRVVLLLTTGKFALGPFLFPSLLTSVYVNPGLWLVNLAVLVYLSLMQRGSPPLKVFKNFNLVQLFYFFVKSCKTFTLWWLDCCTLNLKVRAKIVTECWKT